MVNNKDGFTLTELIAVLVILTLLVSVGTITFINVRSKVLKKQYDNLVTYLEAKAAEYANETNITTISVEDLIKEGVITPDDQSSIYNPETKESMNCYIIKSTFENGRYVAKLSGNLGVNNGTCNTYVKTGKFEICKYNDTLDKCDSFDNGKWFNQDITLGVKYTNSDNILTDADFNWSSTNGFSSKESFIKTETSFVSQSSYKCEITVDESIGEASKIVNVDKQGPSIIEMKYDKEWKASKSVIVDASDMGGSGIDGYAFVKESEECSNYVNENSKEFSEAGSYKVCIKDKAGNVKTEDFSLEKIDASKPVKPNIVASDNKISGEWHVNSFNLSFTSDGEQSVSKIVYNYGYDNNSFIYSGDTVEINDVYNGKTLYVKACNEAGTCSDVNNYQIKVDLVKPSITIKSKSLKYGIGSTEDLINNVTVVDNESGVDYTNVFVDNSIISNISSLSVGVYTVRYEAYDKAGNKSVSENIELTVFVPQIDVDFTGDEIEYVVPLDGTYRINLWGAQGAGNGGKGAYLGVTTYLKQGDILKMAVGGTNGYNGGGIGVSGTYNGGGSTTVKKNGTYLVRAAGGGGGTSGTSGGSDTGAGGASAGNGAGVSGTNSGGGSSSADYNYSCNCSTCGGGCKSTSSYDCNCSTCGGGCKEYYDHYCAEWADCTDRYPGCKTCVKDVANCKTYYPTYDCNCSTCYYCDSYYPTYDCNCSTCTTKGNSGRGGSNYVATDVTIVEKTDGKQTGNGKLELKYVK